MELNTGIYKITNTYNDKIYVGSAINLKRRKGEHFYSLKRGDHHNNYLQNSYNKYGKNNFKFAVLHYCEKDELIPLEQTEITLSECTDPSIGYNICPTAGSNLGRKLSQEHKDKLSKVKKGKSLSRAHKDKLSKAKKGKVLSKETRDKISKSSIGKVMSQESIEKMSKAKKGKVLTQEHKDNISKANKGQVLSQEHREKICKPVSVYKDGVHIRDYKSMTEAANKLNIHGSHISRVLLGKLKHAGGYTFKLK